MVSTKLLFLLLLASLLFACDTTDDSIKNEGGEELLDVYADYSFCYDTGAYDPTQRHNCEMPLTYKECKTWMAKQEGTGNTVFYANFTGGEPTTSARTANRYYMVVHYANKTEKTDSHTVFKDIPSEFMHFADGKCHPNATIEIYNMDDEVMGSMSLNYS